MGLRQKSSGFLHSEKPMSSEQPGIRSQLLRFIDLLHLG